MLKRSLLGIAVLSVSVLGCTKSANGPAEAENHASVEVSPAGDDAHADHDHAHYAERYRETADRYLDDGERMIDDGVDRVRGHIDGAADSLQQTRDNVSNRVRARADQSADAAANAIQDFRAKSDAAEAELQRQARRLRSGFDRLESAIDEIKSDATKPAP